MNENEIYLVKEYNFDDQPYNEMDSVIDSCFEGFHKKYFHKFKYACITDIKFKIIANNEMINFTVCVCGKNMDLYNVNNKLRIARGNGFMFNQINKLTKKIIRLYAI